MTDQALAGYKVLDLGQYIAGPYCGKLLAGLGAEVIKVEKPEGDPSRRMGPFFQDDPHPEKSIHFLYLNTKKKGITLDLKTEAGKKIFKELVRESDILVENFRPGVMANLGLDYETLERINPKLIMTSISNFGQTGPYRDYKALDINLIAMCGSMYAMGEPDREPLTYGGSAAQYWGGMDAFTASLIALYCREISGEGQYIDISIQECMGTLPEQTDTRYQFAKTAHPRYGNRWMGIALWGARPCKDGWVCVVSGMTTSQWLALGRDLLGIPELGDEKYGSMVGRLVYSDEIEDMAAPRLMELTKEEIFHRGQALGSATSTSPTAEDIVNSAQLKARDFWTEVDHPVVGKWIYPGGPIKMRETPFEFGPAPTLGEHNEEVYCKRLGYSKEDLVRLKETGVI
jgi:crotonobetainyl-CoA:carnitine CoA-transferase CaiB-like acyl-CoA transferase